MPRAKKSITPRPYLSWSALSLWEKDKERWARVYLHGETFTTRHMELGREVAEMLEKDKPNPDPIKEHIRLLIPRYQTHEFEIKVTSDAGVPLLGKLDGFTRSPLTIGEVKTGKSWDKKRVDQTEQLTFYTMLVYKKFKRLPDKILLHWAETWEDEDGLRLTGNIETFETKRGIQDVFKMTARAEKAWKEIEKFTKEYTHLF